MTMKRLISLRRREEQEAFAYTGVANVEKLGSEDGVTEVWHILVSHAGYTFAASDFLGAPVGSTFKNIDATLMEYKIKDAAGTWRAVTVT